MQGLPAERATAISVAPKTGQTGEQMKLAMFNERYGFTTHHFSTSDLRLGKSPSGQSYATTSACPDRSRRLGPTTTRPALSKFPVSTSLMEIHKRLQRASTAKYCLCYPLLRRLRSWIVLSSMHS